MEPMQLLLAIHEQLQQLQERVADLTAEVALLRAENERLHLDHQQQHEEQLHKQTASSAQLPFRRLTYHIQNLNVTTLSGTLNVGLVTAATEDQVLHHLTGFGVETADAPDSAAEPESAEQESTSQEDPTSESPRQP